MGRYLNLCSSSGKSILKSYCKIKYLMSILRKIHCRDQFRFSFQPQPFSTNPTRKTSGHKYPRNTFFKYHHTSINIEYSREHFYSTSSRRDEFKVEAPVGILEETQENGQLSRLGGRLGQSFNQLSTHINMYFKRKNTESPAKSSNTRTATPLQTATQECNLPQNKATLQTFSNNETIPPPSLSYLGVQLFHSSYLATRFGESYYYVAKHINSFFSRGDAQGKEQDHFDMHSRSEQINTRKFKNVSSDATHGNQKATNIQNSTSSSWEEGYAMFATHINKYFGALATDKKKPGEYTLPQTSKHLPNKLNQVFESKDGLDGLFHSSHNATHFGENHFQMANHVNQYFKGETLEEIDLDETEVAPAFTNSGQMKTVSLLDCLLHPSSAIPDFLNIYLRPNRINNITSPRNTWNNKFLSKRQAEEVTYNLITTLEQTTSPEDLASCIEALNENLIRYPSCRMVLWQKKTAVLLLRKRRSYKNHEGLQNAIREVLALVGYVDPAKGRGIRVLSIDGGGTRGVVPLQVLKVLEAQTGRKIPQLFDYICGVSTGAVLAFMLGLAHFSLRECEDMYQHFGSEVFCQNPFVGTVKMGWSHSYYDTETWETILREKLGERLLIKTARDELSPKVSAVSAVVNWGTSPKAFVFRNYNHSPGSLSRYAGGSGYQMWQAVRASSAAPGYFQEFTLQGDIHQDGGIIVNNPCALAVHESRLLWPHQPFQCVLSLGTGRYDSVKRNPATSTSLRAKISNLICSATDTEGVHTLLDDLLAPNVYFRFNPTMSTVVALDESRPGALEVLRQDTQEYLERNHPKLARLCLVLGAERSAMSKTMDWMSERAWGMKQRWV
ncbi:calcium-independent phospholipase A2-gamma-like [Boleophthalmus pectinirostris]|uniref:calcium-independent phospholipase A2-gamma-like n=1 Tax=Boleophthalmus pectinirostris TaxID=150288 RepID=UPI00242DB9FF|nr:calcium-independent phospholipase A2-gamma-like [Boleophthalmus pectinirostris]XP_055022446.1 calcium-independent phospholipase A2-gamma-like [Boleophthalmus pectinirostris]